MFRTGDPRTPVLGVPGLLIFSASCLGQMSAFHPFLPFA